jgi:hypothetical protein
MSAADNSLASLTEKLSGPLDVVTTIDVDAARTALARRGLTDLEAMLGIDDQGRADGIARGVWTQVG